MSTKKIVGQKIVSYDDLKDGAVESITPATQSMTLKNQTFTYSGIYYVPYTFSSDEAYSITLKLQGGTGVRYRVILTPSDSSDTYFIVNEFSDNDNPSFIITGVSYGKMVLVPVGNVVNGTIATTIPVITDCSIQKINKVDLPDNIIKLGVQAEEGTTVNINGEDIKMDKTEVYEIYNGYTINSVFLEGESQKSAIIDYVYEEEVVD